jgi:hypothetical protein
MQLADWLTLSGDILAAGGLWAAAYSIYKSNQNSSAASLIALHEALRQAWERFLAATDEEAKQHHFADLANTLEITSALTVKGAFVGVTHELITEYLDDVMRLLDDNEDARTRLERLIHSPTTFKYLRVYVKRRPVCRRDQ